MIQRSSSSSSGNSSSGNSSKGADGVCCCLNVFVVAYKALWQRFRDAAPAQGPINNAGMLMPAAVQWVIMRCTTYWEHTITAWGWLILVPFKPGSGCCGAHAKLEVHQQRREGQANNTTCMVKHKQRHQLLCT
jgi:hypothetical protein